MTAPTPRWTDDDLFGLLDALRQAGFPVGVGEQLRVVEAVEVARRLGVADQPARLRNHISPVVAGSAEQQAAFAQHFNDWWIGLGGQHAEVGALPPAPPLAERPLGVATQRASRWRYIAAAWLAAAVVVSATAPLWWGGDLPEVDEAADMGPDAAVASAGDAAVPARTAVAPGDAAVVPGDAAVVPVDAAVVPANPIESPEPPVAPPSDAPPVAAPAPAPGRLVIAVDGSPLADAVAEPSASRTLSGHRGRITRLAANEAGTMLASASADGTARLWWLAGGVSRRLGGYPGGATALAFSASGAYVVARLPGGQLRRWSVARPDQPDDTPQASEDDDLEALDRPWGVCASTPTDAHGGAGAGSCLDAAGDPWVRLDTPPARDAGEHGSGGGTLAHGHPDGRIELTPVEMGETPWLKITHRGFRPAWAPLPGAGPSTLVILAPRPPWYVGLLPHWRAGMVAFGVLCVALTLAWLAWRRRRRRLILERRPAAADQSVTSIGLPTPERDLYQGAAFARTRVLLRERVDAPGAHLDADATVAATIENLGWFTPVYGRYRKPPTYLALIQSQGEGDQAAQRVHVLLDRLHDGGVDVVRYTYRHDPRRLVGVGGARTRRDLAEVAGLHAGHRLLVFDEGEGLCHPLTGRPAPWLTLFEAWPERALLTTLPVTGWGLREAAFTAQGMMVLPATQAGLACYVAAADATPEPTPGGPWPESFESAPGRWQSRHAPPPAEVDALLAELRRFLGPDGYRWLQGLAAHPELRWPLTLFIGLRLQADGEPLLSERRLIDLTRLPWLRAGWLPDWLRLRLLAGISPGDDQAVRAFLQDLLAQQSDRHQAFRLDVARRDPQRAGSRRRWRQLIADILRAEPADSPLHDRLFVDFLQGRKLGALQLSAPGGLRRLVWSQGLRGLGLRRLPVVAFSAALLAACVVLSVGLHRLEARFLQPATFFTSPLADPGDHQLSRRDGLGIVAAGFCTDGSDGIAIADPAPDLDCGAALLPDEPTDAVLGGLSTSPLLQAATVTRLRPDQGLMVVATGRFAHLVRTDGPGTMVLSVEHPEPIVAVDLAPDGSRLLTASSLKVLVWGVDARTQDPRSARDSFTLEPESERPGDDLRDFDAGSADDCRSACAAEARCEAFTFASRGSWSGVDPHCWLKRVASDKVLKRGHYSGMRVRPVEIENQTAVVMTGEVAYSHCPIQSFTIAPGALWTGAPRKDCAITGITAAPPRVPGPVPSGAVPFQGRTQAPGFRIVSWGQRQRVVATDGDVGSATFSPATYTNGCVGRLDVQAAPGWRVQEIRGDGDVQVNGGVTFPPGPARIARVGVAFQGSGGLQNENIELALPACKLIPRAVPNAAGDRAYLYDTTLRTYDEQRRLAADMGGHLATLTTPEELAFVTPLAVAIGPWIGLWSPRKDGVFETITGEPAGPPPFCAGEPNNAGRDEYAGELWDQGCLNDEGPTKPRGLLVEFERPGVPEDLSQGGTFVRPGAPAGQSDRTFIRVTRPTNVALDVHDEGGSCKAGTRLLIVRRAGDVVMPDTGVSPCPSIGMPLDPGLYDVNVAGLGGPLEPYQIKATFYISRDPARRPPSATLLQAF